MSAMNSRQQHASTARRSHSSRATDRSDSYFFKGPQSLAPNIEELRHYILTTGLPSTPNGIVLPNFSLILIPCRMNYVHLYGQSSSPSILNPQQNTSPIYQMVRQPSLIKYEMIPLEHLLLIHSSGKE